MLLLRTLFFLLFFSLMIRLPPTSTLFPYTTLFRSTAQPLNRLVAQVAPNRSAAYLFPTDVHDARAMDVDRKSTRLNSSHANISYAVFCLKKKIHLLDFRAGIAERHWLRGRHNLVSI